jgi:thioredoxin-dependent peroxiredoxin
MSDPDPQLPSVGSLAPDFTLPDDTGAQRTLSAERGHWLVLYFYPADDTPGCTTEACQFRDETAAYGELGATVWGVSKYGVDSKAAFKAKFELPFTLLADEDHAVSTLYGAWVLRTHYGRSSWGIRRCTVLIDPAGRVARTWSQVKADGHAAEVLASLRELISKPAT